MIDDIAQLCKSLKISRVVIFGFSAFGIVALEFAKKYPHMVLGIIMVGTPVNSNKMVAQLNNAYFEQHADPERKRLYADRSTQLAEQDLRNLSYSDRFLRKYIYEQSARYWHKPNFDCSELWHDIVVDRVLDHLFDVIFPSIDVTKNLIRVECSIFLAADMSDYDCCPWQWQEVKNLPHHMHISIFEKSGHYPHYEEQKLFDDRIAQWVDEKLKN